MKCACIILAAGQGTRFGAKKQFIEFNGKELWKHTYDKISKLINKENIVVVGVDVQGGNTRSKSVINGLIELNKRGKFDRVVILEAARPLVTIDQLTDIINDSNPSVTYVLPLVNTIIKKDCTYLDRNDYYSMTTPVAFDFELLYNAYMSERFIDTTDDTRVMYEYYGIKPHFIIGAENLMKLTYPSDLYVLEMLSKKYDC